MRSERSSRREEPATDRDDRSRSRHGRSRSPQQPRSTNSCTLVINRFHDVVYYLLLFFSREREEPTVRGPSMRSERSLRREEPATDRDDKSRSRHNYDEDAEQTTPVKSARGSRYHRSASSPRDGGPMSSDREYSRRARSSPRDERGHSERQRFPPYPDSHLSYSGQHLWTRPISGNFHSPAVGNPQYPHPSGYQAEVNKILLKSVLLQNRDRHNAANDEYIAKQSEITSMLNMK